MKSNIIKYLLVALGVIGAIAPITNSSAYRMRDLIDDFNSCSSCVHNTTFINNWWSYWLQYYDINEWVISMYATYWVSLDYMANVRSSRLIRSQPNVWYVAYPLVWFADNGAWWITFKYFMHWSDAHLEDYNVWSRAWFTHTFNDWHSCLIDQVYFNVWSIIFKCSDSDRTFQILAWWYTLWNKFLYIDIYNSTNNLWWISWSENKARSITLEKEDLSEILYWDVEINQSLMESLFNTWYSSYTISSWWTNIFPTCWLKTCNTQGMSHWFSYTRDLISVDPDFWWSNSNTPNEWNNFVPIWWSAYSWYLTCFQDWTEISSFANSRNDCRSQAMSSWMNLYEFMDVEDYVLNFTWDDNENWRDITDNVSCQAFMLSAKLEYDQYWSWYYSHLVSVAKNYKNASNSLPVEAYCWSNPLTHETNTITTREDIYWESQQANSPLSWEDCSNWFTCTLQEWINAPKQYVYDNLIWSYSGAFHSWYNAVDFVSCPTQSYRSTNYWNYIFIAWVVFLVFIFISII